ncbi:isocitrate lyase/phosphoenolpyruvate mutase family protein [Phytohabitans sp. ZYX-F-186]|uniref:Isocitrate lyase/phosphoenolpyruvate mutase family protein n=1 Tax=Phytohabitans maris TaxID=3071409 RepID=A0ABU0ZP24_9ACTN|nr:isocitrate lyase/phosphoenolpyruvate mutase family protein [Phytohabitans sp. ZYX-F-186]MDQ7908788.1 isocitrate lyase/phosphoenolpyruvate mutase family protein [Phytohabitans sp. ZYX-F-186]
METFWELHHGERPLVLPNAWDYASAAALAARGFAAVGTTSLGVAAGAGKVDGTGAIRAETVDLARRLRRLPCPVSVDIEGGFGERPDEVADLVAELAGLGVAGVNIEDGRADGTLAPIDEQQSVIGSAKSRVPGMFVNARTDTHWRRRPTPAALEEALRRARGYAEAGADGVFVPGVTGDAAIGALVAMAGVPLNVLYVPGVSLDRLAALGVRRVSTGSLLFRAALTAAVETAAAVAAPVETAAAPAAAVARAGSAAKGLVSYEEVQALNELTAGARTTDT